MKANLAQLYKFARTFLTCILALNSVATSKADVVRELVGYSPDTIAGWQSIDFDGDGAAELSFRHLAIGYSLESGGVMHLNIFCSPSIEILQDNGTVVPLHPGETVSLTPLLGQWQGSEARVWSVPFGASPGSDGVGTPGQGDFMGVRFVLGSDWHCGWVRFGILNTPSPLPQTSWPSVLEYAYETSGNTPIAVPEPRISVMLLVGWILVSLYALAQRRKVVQRAVRCKRAFWLIPSAAAGRFFCYAGAILLLTSPAIGAPRTLASRFQTTNSESALAVHIGILKQSPKKVGPKLDYRLKPRLDALRRARAAVDATARLSASSEDAVLPAALFGGTTDFEAEWQPVAQSGAALASDGLSFRSQSFSAASLPLSVAAPIEFISVPLLLRDDSILLPIGDWLLKISGTEVQVLAADEPAVIVRSYPLDDLPVLGATIDGTRVHILQGRTSPVQYGYQSLNLLNGMTALTLDESSQTNSSLFQHTILDAASLPELDVLGVSIAETSDSGMLAGAKPLWATPELLVWALERQARNYQWGIPTFHLMPAIESSFTTYAPNDLQIHYFAPAVIWQVAASPKISFLGSSAPNTLLAVDVSNSSAPQVLSETGIGVSFSTISDVFAANGQIFYSHTTSTSEVIGTNVTFRTNYVSTAVTNIIWQTNISLVPVQTSVTNVPPPALVNAMKLNWSGSTAGAHVDSGMEHALMLNAEGDVFGWGNNSAGALGPGMPSTVWQASQLSLARPMSSISVGLWHNLGLDSFGQVWQWGSPDGPLPPMPGQSPRDYSVPEAVSLPAPATEIAAGGSHSLALAADGRLWSWGQNYDGQLGIGHRDSVTGPQPVPGLFVKIAGGAWHSLALDAAGRVHSWGWDDYGQLGREGTPDSPGTIAAPPNASFRDISAGAIHSLALADDGSVWGWGDNSLGSLGASGSGNVTPQPIAGIPAAREIVAGWLHSLVLAENGEVWLLQDYPGTKTPALIRVEGLTNVVTLGAGVDSSLALTADGSLFVWGGHGSLISESNATAQLTLVGVTPVVETVTNHLPVTNISHRTEITYQYQPRVTTNETLVYRNGTKHWLDVVDFADPAAPVLREAASLPGRLVGLSHEGLLLYAQADVSTGANGSLRESRLYGLAYDNVAAHLVNTLMLTTNSAAESVKFEVHPEGPIVLARENWSNASLNSLECWQLDMRGQFRLLGSLERTARSYSMILRERLALLSTDAGFELVDFERPMSPVALPVNPTPDGIRAEINFASGGASTGIWFPAGAQGAFALWRP